MKKPASPMGDNIAPDEREKKAVAEYLVKEIQGDALPSFSIK